VGEPKLFSTTSDSSPLVAEGSEPNAHDLAQKILPAHYINRELSWLEFNARVLEEAQDESTPLLERVKFLSIFSSNLDEFFMVRVAGLREQSFQKGAPQDFNPDMMRAISQLEAICQQTHHLVSEQYDCLTSSVLPALEQEGIQIVSQKEIGSDEDLDRFFQETVFPIITPMAIDPSHPRPRYHNRAVYLGAMLKRRKGLGPKKLFAVVQIPRVLPRLVLLKSPEAGCYRFAFLEDLVATRLPELFGGFEIRTMAAFRITRDSDIDLIEQEADDMLQMIEKRLKARHRTDAVRLEISADADDELVQMIVEQEHIRSDREGESDYHEVYRIPGPVDLTGLLGVTQLPNLEHLRDPPYKPTKPRGLRQQGEDLFDAIARRDILLHHPYDSFSPVVDFVNSAAVDPKVLAIKQTLYRTSGDSPVVRALMQAAEEGKHVTALVELKARFDEEANVSWARQLERSGVHVIFGFLDLKTHCKVSLVVRQEDSGVRRYAHLSTGNYNPTTAKIYTDLGLFTTDEDIVEDASALFNLLTGYSQGHQWRKLVVAPDELHRKTIDLIEEQMKVAMAGKPSRIFAKLNSLVDYDVIESLYRASQAGVPIELLVRGICCLRPGIEGISDNIRVTSIVDRYLEHSRIFVFGSGSHPKVFLSSADWMPRNFHRRVEVMFPIKATNLKKRILSELIPNFTNDNVKARVLQSDGSYRRVKSGTPKFRCQEKLMRMHSDETSAKKTQITDPNVRLYDASK